MKQKTSLKESNDAPIRFEIGEIIKKLPNVNLNVSIYLEPGESEILNRWRTGGLIKKSLNIVE